MNKRILIIAHDFFPYSFGTGSYMRVATLADFLAKNNKVYIISAKGKLQYQNQVIRISNKIKLHNVLDPLLLLRFGHFNNKNDYKGVKYIKELKNRLLMNLLPDLSFIWAIIIKNSVFKIIKNCNIDTVIISGPPFSPFILAKYIKNRFNNINLLIEYRDGWHTSGIFNKNKILFCNSLYLEKTAVSYADKIICVAPSNIEKLSKMFPFINKNKIFLCRNGFLLDKELLIRTRKNNYKNENFILGYFGTISDAKNSIRNPRYFFEALMKLPESVRSKIEIHFFGQCLLGKYEGLNIFLHPPLSYEEAFIIMRRCDALLTIHYLEDGAEDALAAKVYDYIASGKPVLAVGPYNFKDTFDLITELRCGEIAIINDIESMHRAILAIYDAWEHKLSNKYEVSIERALEFHRHEQYKIYLKII